MGVIVKVCLSECKAKWTTGSVQHRPVVTQMDFLQMRVLTATHSQSVSQATHSYSHCLTIHICRVHSTNCEDVCVRASSLQDATAISRQWSTPTHPLFILFLLIYLLFCLFSLPLFSFLVFSFIATPYSHCYQNSTFTDKTLSNPHTQIVPYFCSDYERRPPMLTSTI